MDHIQNSAEDEEEIEVVPIINITKNDTVNVKEKNHYKHVNNNRIYNNGNDDEGDIDNPHKKYSKEANSRTKRAARFQEKNTCSLYIQTDPLIWRHIRESIPDHNDPNRSGIVDEKAKEEILSLVAHHVAAVNFIYRESCTLIFFS